MRRLVATVVVVTTTTLTFATLGSTPAHADPKVDHVHFFGMYFGNYPDLERERILELCELLNKVRA